ncbi:Protein kinase [Apiospora sp. TS-2023a]
MSSELLGSFSQSAGTVPVAILESNDASYNLITFLGAVQLLPRATLPIPLYYDEAEPPEFGGTANIRHTLLSNKTSLSFKRIQPGTLFRNPDSEAGHDIEAKCYRLLISEISHLFLVHPNIIRLLGVAWESGIDDKVWPVLVFKRAPHGDLRAFTETREQPLSWKQKLSFVVDMARALEYTHAASIIHGDMKPSNVFVCFDENRGDCPYSIQLADFGYATFGLKDEDLVMLPCSPSWAHPDRYHRGCPIKIAKKIDVFGLGMVSLWLFFGDLSVFPNDEERLTELGGRKMPDLANRLLEASSYDMTHRSILQGLFQRTLIDSHEERATIEDVLLFLAEHTDPIQTPKPPVDRNFLPNEFMANFNVAPAAFILSHIDYRVRSQIVRKFEELLPLTSSASEFGKSIALQLALCYKLGFGVRKDDAMSDKLLERGHHTPQSLSEQLQALDDGVIRVNHEFDEIWSGGLVRVVDLADVYRKRPFSRGESLLTREAQEHRRELCDVASVLGESHVLTISLRTTLACLLRSKGDLAESCELFEKVLQDKESSGQPVTEAKMDLGNVYSDLGQHQKAIALADEVFRTYESSLGRNHPLTIDSMSILSKAHFDYGNQDMALVEAQANVRRLLDLRGEDHPQTLEQMDFLSQVYFEKEDLVSSSILNEKVLEKRTRILGENHPDTLSSRHLSAMILIEKGEHAAGASREREVLASYERVLGKGHPKAIEQRASVANTLANIDGDYWAEADKLSSDAVDESALTVGKQHPITIDCMYTRMMVLLEMDRVDKVIELGNSACKAARESLPPSHDSTSNIINTLGLAYDKSEDYETAQRLLEEALQMRLEKLGPSHSSSLESQLTLASCFASQGKLELAKSMEEESLNTMKRALGTSNHQTISCMLNLGSTLWDLEQYSDAKCLETQALELAKTHLGETHAITLEAMTHLAATLSSLSQWDDALQLAGPAFELSRTNKGVDHTHTIEAMMQVAEINAAQGRTSEASNLYQEAMEIMRDGGAADDHWQIKECKEILRGLQQETTETGF